ncbi:MAG: YceI family protein [Pseudomonadota bacterium]
MKRVVAVFRAAFVALAFVATLAVAAPVYPVVAARSSLAFSGTQQGERFNGVFRAFEARIQYAPDDLAGSHFDVTIPLKSLDSKNSERDAALATAEWFDFTHFPNATFRTVAMHMTATGVVADADVTIKGRTRRIAFPFTWKGSASGATLDARVTLDRLDYGLGTGDWADDAMVGRKVEVTVRLVLGPVVPVEVPAAKPTLKAVGQPKAKR